MCFNNNSTVLFQGDSITDCGRNYETDDLGNGYVKKIADYFSIFHSGKNIRFINKGINGHKACDLANRWTKDCIELKPDYVSILIGINDTWRRYDCNSITTAEEFENNYRILLDRIKNETNAKIILMEPFIIPVKPEMSNWYEDLQPKISIIRKLAIEYNAVYISLDGPLAEECAKLSKEQIAEDGVHPTDLGHSIIAKRWIKLTGNK
jgi:acyl-CoA thioesterase-1